MQHMKIITRYLEFSTHGSNHIVNITEEIADVLRQSGIQEGNATISAIGSTTGITTLEYEPGLVNHDVAQMFDHFAPYGRDYKHNQTWGDDNGAAHLRSMLTGTSQVIPFVDGKLVLGTWQQVVFIDFDTRPRNRRVAVQLMGA